MLNSLFFALTFFSVSLFPSSLIAANITLEKSISSAAGTPIFSYLAGLSATADGELYGVDSLLGQVMSLSSEGWQGFDSSHKGLKFQSPFLAGIAHLDEGRLVVSDSLSGTLALLDAEGKITAFLAGKGSQQGRLNKPKGLFFSHNRRLYVAEMGAGRVSVFGADGVFLHSFGDKKSGRSTTYLKAPEQVFVDAQERVFVLETADSGRIMIYAHDGAFLQQLSAADVSTIVTDQVSLSAIALDQQGVLYVADNRNGRVYQLDWQQKKLLNRFGSKGNLRGQFSKITALLALPDQRLAVADSGNHKIEIFHLNGSLPQQPKERRLATLQQAGVDFIRCQFAYRLKNNEQLCVADKNGHSYRLSREGKKTEFEGQLQQVAGVAISAVDIVITAANSVKVYRHDGHLRFSLGRTGSQDGSFNQPRGVALKNDRLYVADSGNARLQIFSQDGVFIDKISAVDFDDDVMGKPVAVALDSQNRIYVADEGSGQILVFSPEHKLLHRLNENQTLARPFEHFYDLAIDSQDRLYVLAASSDNDYSVRIFQGLQPLFSFGSAAEFTPGFKQARNLSFYPSEKTEIGLYDSGWGRLFRFAYRQVPDKVMGLKIRGQKKGSYLSWSSVSSPFVDHYRVYVAEKEGGPFRLLHEIKENHTYIEHTQSGALYYQVSAVSDYGREGALSTAQEDLFRAAFRAYQLRNYRQAIHFFSRLQLFYEDDPQTLLLLGKSLLALGRSKEAQLYFSLLAEVDEHRAEGLRLKLEALYQGGQDLRAQRVVKQLIAAKLADEPTYLRCARISLRLSDAIGAVNCLESLLAEQKKHAEAHFLLGQAYLKLGLQKKALTAFDTAVKLDRGDSAIRYRSALVLQGLGKHRRAIRYLQEAKALADQEGDILMALAESYLALKKYAKVRHIALSLLAEDRYLSHGHYLLGLIAVAQNNPDEALLAFNKATHADDQNAPAWLALAELYKKRLEPKKVLHGLQKALSANPNSFAAAWGLGEQALAAKNYPLALESLGRAAVLQADHRQVHFRLASAFYHLDRLQEALPQALEAKRLLPDSVEVLHLLAEITHEQGKSGEAIRYLKQAIKRQPANEIVQVALAELYIENNLYEKAEPLLQKALLLAAKKAPIYLLMANMFSQRRLFERAIAALDKAVAIAPTAENRLLLESAYANKKQSMQFKSNAPQVVFEDLRLNTLFSVAYKQYATEPVGTIRLRNTGGSSYANLKLSFEIKGYMDFPSLQEIGSLKANSSLNLSLYAALNNRVLQIDEDTGVQVEVKLLFVRDGREQSISLTQPVTLYGKNAILWQRANMVGSFVTPKDEVLHNFVRQVINEHRPKPGPLNANMVTAMTLFDAFAAQGLRYVQDPNSPYSKVQRDQVDYVQFARETLHLKSGDCDDLSVLLSASLENLGIETAFLDVPGHLLMMFNTGLAQQDRNRISAQNELLVIYQDQVWIPLEATMIATSFSEAWTEGAAKYQHFQAQNKLKVIALKKAWQRYQPVTLQPASFELKVADSQALRLRVQREQRLLLEKSLERELKPYQALLASRPNDAKRLMQTVILYARYGLYDRAHRVLDELEKRGTNGALYNNRANLFFAQGDFEQALEHYRYAEGLLNDDAGIKVNMAMSHYRLGDLRQARLKFEQAVLLQPATPQSFAAFDKLLQ
ncbi:MAG: tetratricopeptide repeat protein [Gammaproteobacteria bacterium]|nr:tetratricopeptide repeat protein [Gammaproteobacteria bacterium]